MLWQRNAHGVGGRRQSTRRCVDPGCGDTAGDFLCVVVLANEHPVANRLPKRPMLKCNPHEPLAPLWVVQLAEPITVTVTAHQQLT